MAWRRERVGRISIAVEVGPRHGPEGGRGGGSAMEVAQHRGRHRGGADAQHGPSGGWRPTVVMEAIGAASAWTRQWWRHGGGRVAGVRVAGKRSYHLRGNCAIKEE
jgi:hypothetical protein